MNALLRLSTAGLMFAALVLSAGAVAGERIDALFHVNHSGAQVGELRWTIDLHDDGAVVFDTHNRTVGVARLLRDVTIRARSAGRIEGERYYSTHYRYERDGDKRAGHVDARFDHEAGTVRIERLRKGKLRRRSESLDEPLTDELGHMLEVGAALAAGDMAPRSRVLRRDKVRLYRYAVEGTEAVDTPLGSVDAVRLRRDRADDADRSTTIWSAAEARYLPVRIAHREGQRTVEIVLVSWSTQLIP